MFVGFCLWVFVLVRVIFVALAPPAGAVSFSTSQHVLEQVIPFRDKSVPFSRFQYSGV